ncbi:MAG: hypothetical protein RJA70_4643 [Pseudomonadota bacterium]|jgi:type IV pilus assembly protein PilP
MPSLYSLGPSALRLLVFIACVGCEDEVVQNIPPVGPSAKPTGAAKAAKATTAAAGGASADEEQAPTAPPKVEYQEEDFSETERSRDPFRSFADLFAAQSSKAVHSQRTVLLEGFPVDSLKLIGIVSRIEPAKAMLLDPTGQGHVVHRNDYIGKAERVQVGTTNAEYEINWRVDRIRESDVVLIREDPTNPDIPSATRVIALRPEDEKSR